MLYLGLFNEEILEDRRVMSFSMKWSEMDLTIQELEGDLHIKKLIEDEVVSENARLKQAEVLAPGSNWDTDFDDIEIVNQVNANFDESVDDILNVIDQEINDETAYLGNFKGISFCLIQDLKRNTITQTAISSQDLALNNFQSADLVLSKRH